MVAGILAASAGAGVIKGCRHAWLHDGDTDMQARVAEYQLFRDGIYPNPRIDVSPPTRSRRFTVYPPYALPLFIPFFEPGGKLQGRVIIEIVSALSLGVMAAWGWRRFRPWGVPMAAIAAGGLWLQRHGSRRGSIDRLLAAAVIPVLCMITIYHRNYDHVMLWPLLLATLEQALARRQRIDALVAIATAVSLFAPERLFSLVPFAAEARALVWIGAAVHLLRARGLSPLAPRPLEAAAPSSDEPVAGDLQGCDRGSQG